MRFCSSINTLSYGDLYSEPKLRWPTVQCTLYLGKGFKPPKDQIFILEIVSDDLGRTWPGGSSAAPWRWPPSTFAPFTSTFLLQLSPGRRIKIIIAIYNRPPQPAQEWGRSLLSTKPNILWKLNYFWAKYPSREFVLCLPTTQGGFLTVLKCHSVYY